MVIPYFKQETNYTCGAACMRMVLAAMGIKKTEKQLANLLQTNKKIGTWHKNIPELAEKYLFDYTIVREAKFSNLKEYSKNGWHTIVCFTRESVPHYAVVKKVSFHRIYLLDPYYGPEVSFTRRQFKKKWHDHENKRWFIAIKSNAETIKPKKR